MNETDLGQIIRHIRKKEGLSQQQLADMAGTTQTLIGNYERGVTMPLHHTLMKILGAMGYTLKVVKINDR